MFPLYVWGGPLAVVDNLSPVMQETLIDLHIHGDNVPGNIGDNIDRHPNSVSRALRQMTERETNDFVRNKGRGVWTLTDEGEKVAEQLAELKDLTDSGE